MVQPTKQELRQRILDLIKTQKEEDALRKSRVILDKILALPVFETAQTIMFYASFQGEVARAAPANSGRVHLLPAGVLSALLGRDSRPQ